MEDRRSTKIPRPPGALCPLTSNEVETVDIMNRKRKGPSPAKPEAKRAASGSAATNTRAPQSSAAAPNTAASGSAPEEKWEHISEELGWSPEDCLNHKLTFKKKEDIKVTKDTLLQHIKRLRAMGWHLLLIKEKHELDAEVTKGALAQEEAGRKEDREALEKTVNELGADKAELQSHAKTLEANLAQKGEECEVLQGRLTASEAASAAAAAEIQQLQAERVRLQEQLADCKKQLMNATELHQHAQKYNSQLQEYNTKLQTDLQAASAQLRGLQEERNAWSGESAALRGNISALESQVAAAQSAAAAADEARGLSTADAGRLRSEIAQLTKQRDQLQADLTAQQQELTRYKECTGKSVENLEREKASKAALQNQNKAQVEFNCELQEELAQLRAQLAVSQTGAQRQAGKAADIEAQRAQLETALQAAEQRLRDGELVRRKLHNTILELKGNIRVFCRVRPLTLDNPTTETVDGKPLIQFPTSGELVGQGLELAMSSGTQQPATHKFAFDKVFGPSSQQEEVFEEMSQLVQSALDGYKVCIFAYGQTGSGKTYTMVGPSEPQHRGVIPRAVHQLFEASHQLEEQGWAFEMKASMLEIYNEEVKDLLGKGPPAGKKHQISHDDRGTTSITFVESVDCKRPEKVKHLLERATRMRSVGATAANEQSSRSHMVFTMTITGTNETSGQQISGVLNLIDLAGSERLSKSLATGDRLKETQAINKSLSALGDVIMALGNKESHVPFRNSKLTYLLQPCLGGDAKTLMFVNIAPTAEAANESLCSLRFAFKVNATEIGTARRNVASK